MGKNVSKKKCFSCGKKASFLSYNYAGYKFDVNSNYPFPKRITVPEIQDLGPNYFLCDKCVTNNYKVQCKIHGILKDKYEYGRPPKCVNCEKELEDLKKGHLPGSFRFLVPINKLALHDKYADNDIWFAATKSNEIYIIRNDVLYEGEYQNIKFEVATEYSSIYLKGTPLGPDRIKYFRINLDSDLVFEKGRSDWISYWKTDIQDKLQIDDDARIYFSSFESNKVNKDTKEISVEITKPTFWSIYRNEIKIYKEQIACPSIEKLKNWAIERSGNINKLIFMFEVSNVPSILKILEDRKIEAVDTIEKTRLQESLKTDPDKLNLGDDIGIFDFEFNGRETRSILISRTNSIITCKQIDDGKVLCFDQGYCFNNYFLMISSSDGIYAVSKKSLNEYEYLSNYIKKPRFKEDDNLSRIAFCFDGHKDNSVSKFEFFENGFVLNEEQKINYSDIEKIRLEKNDKYNELTFKIINEVNSKSISLAGEKEYVSTIWKYVEDRKVACETIGLDTNQLYSKYNKLKKKNWLIGLLSNIVLLNKELDEDVNIDDLLYKLKTIDHNEFYENKNLYRFTIKKLYTYIQMIPDIKRNLELMITYFPHMQFKDEINFISEAFGSDIAGNIKEQEYENVIASSRGSIGLLQLKLNRILSEIERSIAPVENLFAKDEIQKEFISKVSKYSSLGGQAALVGTLIAAGGMTGGIGILAGMLGIRGMSDYMNILNKSRESAFIIKQSAEKVFSWWGIFKKAFPVTIYELEKELDKEYKRCVKRDQFLFKKLNQTKKLSINNVNNALKNRIEKTNKVRFNEIIEGTGILFNDISSEIDKTKQIEMSYPHGIDSMHQIE